MYNSTIHIWYKPVCVSEWQFKLDEFVNDLPHCLQGYGFSPVCERWCTLREEGLEKCLSQCSQAYGFDRIP